MKCLKALLVVMLVAVWTLATHHCRIEIIAGIQALVCCPHEDVPTHQDKDCETDGCTQLENALYKSEDPNAGLTAIDFTWPELTTGETSEFNVRAPVQPDHSHPPPAPPELAVSWRFDRRAALPPRAPDAFL